MWKALSFRKNNLQPKVYSIISQGLKATGAEVLYVFSDTRVELALTSLCANKEPV